MKIKDVLSESKAAELRKVNSIKRTIKQFNRLVDEAGKLEEKGQAKRAAKLSKEADELNSRFTQNIGMSIPDYESQQNVSARDPENMINRIKTTDLRVGTSSNFMAAEAGPTAMILHILRDVVEQLDDDIANVLSQFLTSNKKHNPPTKDQITIARAVVDRIKELGLVDAYNLRSVEKLDKDKMKWDYDKEEVVDEMFRPDQNPIKDTEKWLASKRKKKS